MKKILKNSLLTLMILGLSNYSFAEENSGVSNEQATKETINNTQYILANVLQKAKALHEKHGDFAPFGAGLFKSGAVKYVWYAKPGETVKEPAKALPLIRQALQTQAVSNAIVGSAVVYKVGTAKDPKLTVELEYQTGFAIAFASEMTVFPDGKVEWGANSQQNYEARIFNPEVLKAQEAVIEKAKAETEESTPKQ